MPPAALTDEELHLQTLAADEADEQERQTASASRRSAHQTHESYDRKVNQAILASRPQSQAAAGSSQVDDSATQLRVLAKDCEDLRKRLEQGKRFTMLDLDTIQETVENHPLPAVPHEAENTELQHKNCDDGTLHSSESIKPGEHQSTDAVDRLTAESDMDESDGEAEAEADSAEPRLGRTRSHSVRSNITIPSRNPARMDAKYVAWSPEEELLLQSCLRDRQAHSWDEIVEAMDKSAEELGIHAREMTPYAVQRKAREWAILGRTSSGMIRRR